MTGLEFLKAADTTAEEIADVLSKGHPPVSTVKCDNVSCRDCWLAWLTTGEAPVADKKGSPYAPKSKEMGASTDINYQIIPAPGADGKYTPDYSSLIAAASCGDEADYIRSVEARGLKFAYNMVYITSLICGHFEIFQTPQNEHYPLDDILRRVQEYADTSKCTRCICKR